MIILLVNIYHNKYHAEQSETFHFLVNITLVILQGNLKVI